jgi:hypothetical protein
MLFHIHWSSLDLSVSDLEQTVLCICHSLYKNKIGELHCLEYAEILEVFFMPHHVHCQKPGYRGNYKCNSSMKDNGIQDRC